MPNKNWTPEEDSLLRLYVSQGLKTEEIAKKLERSFKSTQHRRSKIQKDAPITYVATQEENDMIKVEEYIGALKELVEKDYQAKRFPTYNLSSKGKSHEILNAVISDLHVGKINTFYDSAKNEKIITYNDAIRMKFEKHYLDSFVRLLNLWKNGYYFEKLKIYLLGDLVDNDRIFEGQTTQISMPVGKQVWTAIAELADMINVLGGFFPEIEVYCVVGNHGRSGFNSKAEEPVENNFEYHLYKTLQLMLEKSERKNIKVIIPETRFYSTENYGQKIFMSHGETIRGASTSYATRKAKEMLINMPEGFNLYIIGHRHQADRLTLSPDSEMLVNGCWIPYDDYAIKLYGISSQPNQWLFGSAKNRVISSICVPLDFKGV